VSDTTQTREDIWAKEQQTEKTVSCVWPSARWAKWEKHLVWIFCRVRGSFLIS